MRHDSKFVDPEFYVDPLAPEFSGVECCITWGQFWGAVTGQGDPEERRRAEEAQREAERAAAEARRLYEEESRRAQEAVAQQQAAMQAQLAEETRIKAEQQRVLELTQRQAGIAKKQAVTAVGQQRVETQQELARSQEQIQQLNVRQTKEPGQTVGQPGISRTKVGTRLSLGGYTGTTPGRINPTGLNI